MQIETKRKGFLQRWRKREGQSLTEYVIIVALIAVSSITAVTVFGNSLRVLFGRVVAGIQGESYNGTEMKDLDKVKDVTKSKDIKNFDE